MKVFFNQLFDYNFHCNKKLIETFGTLEEVPPKCIELFSHMLNAHNIWNARLNRKKPIYDVWQVHDVKQLADIHYENQRASFEITSNTADFELRIDYENTEGRLLTNTVQDILFHIINHSTHHRGQIATEFRANEITPQPLDYIFYKR